MKIVGICNCPKDGYKESPVFLCGPPLPSVGGHTSIALTEMEFVGIYQIRTDDDRPIYLKVQGDSIHAEIARVTN